MQTADASRPIRALDGLRTVAVAVVFALHAGLRTPGGQTGVYLFFALSGFLITSLLLREWQRHGRILLGNFWLRRVLRLYPALVALVVTVTLYSVLVPRATFAHASLTSIPAVLFYAANWVRAFAPVGAQPLGLYEHTWSLAVEEQFYLLWPLVVLATLALRRRVGAVGVVAAAGFVLAVVALLTTPGGDGGHLVYNALHTNAAYILVGAAGAAWSLAVPDASRERGLRVLRVAVWPAALVFLVATWVLHSERDDALNRGAAPVVAIACGVLVLTIAFSPGLVLSRLLASTPMVYAGRRSYAFYLWHYPVIVALRNLDLVDQPGLMRRYGIAALALALSIAASIASYRLVELPFLRWKDRLAARERRGGDDDATTRPASAPAGEPA